MNEEKIIQRLNDWGCDTDNALKRTLDDKAFYIECLQMFYEDKEFAALKEHLDARDVKAAFDSAHTLKGVSANLGLTPLYDTVCKMVEPLRDGHLDAELEEAYPALLSMREELGKRLNP